MENSSPPDSNKPQESDAHFANSETSSSQQMLPNNIEEAPSSFEPKEVTGPKAVDSHSYGFINTLNALLIVLVVAIGAIAAWRASVASDAAGNADYYGLRALINTEETQALNFLTAYRSYSNYIDYWSSKRHGELLEEEMKQKPPLAEDEQFVAQIKNAFDLATASQTEFEQRFLNRDGSYNIQGYIGQLWADAMKKKDLNYESQFTEAERLRNKTVYLLLCVMILSLAPVFYSLVESVNERTQRMMILIGSIFAVAGTLLLLLVEFEKIPL